MIQRIIIHKTLVDSFKRKALKAFPHEHIVAILGKMVGNDLHVCALDELDEVETFNNSKYCFIQYYQPEEEIEAGTTLKYFGTLHSHPAGTLKPSEEDRHGFFKAYNEDSFEFQGHEGEQLCDQIMGIMRIVKLPKIIQHGLAFYDIDFKSLEILISEDRKKKATK